MTAAQMKLALNNELSREGINRKIKTVTDVNAHITLIFEDGYDMKTLKYLNDRFMNGISITETDHSIVFVNTPNEKKVNI